MHAFMVCLYHCRLVYTCLLIALACFVVDQAYGFTHLGLGSVCFLPDNHEGLCPSSGYWGWLPCLSSTGSFGGQLGGLTSIAFFTFYLTGDFTGFFLTHDESGKTFYCYILYLLFISTSRNIAELVIQWVASIVFYARVFFFKTRVNSLVQV